MQSPIPEARAADAVWLSAQIAAFGGRIETLPGPTFAPPPMRKHPEPKPKQPKPLTKAALLRQQCGPVILQLYHEGKNLTQISTLSGRGHVFVRTYLQECGLDANSRDLNKVPDEMVAKLRQMAADRYSCRYAAQCLDLPHSRARSLARKHGFKFVGARS